MLHEGTLPGGQKSRDKATSRAASQPQSLSDSAVFPIYKVKLTFSRVKFYPENVSVIIWISTRNWLSCFLRAIAICPNFLNERFYLLWASMLGKKQQRLETVYCLFVPEWIHILSWKCTVSRILIIFLDIPPIGINTIFLICPPIYLWPQQEFLGVRSPWKCVTLIPNIFPKKTWVKVWWTVERFAWIFQIKKLTQSLVMGERCNWSSMVTWPLTEEWDPGRMRATALHSSITIVLVLFKLERWEGLGSCQR